MTVTAPSRRLALRLTTQLDQSPDVPRLRSFQEMGEASLGADFDSAAYLRGRFGTTQGIENCDDAFLAALTAQAADFPLLRHIPRAVTISGAYHWNRRLRYASVYGYMQEGAGAQFVRHAVPQAYIETRIAHAVENAEAHAVRRLLEYSEQALTWGIRVPLDRPIRSHLDAYDGIITQVPPDQWVGHEGATADISLIERIIDGSIPEMSDSGRYLLVVPRWLSTRLMEEGRPLPVRVAASNFLRAPNTWDDSQLRGADVALLLRDCLGEIVIPQWYPLLRLTHSSADRLVLYHALAVQSIEHCSVHYGFH